MIRVIVGWCLAAALFFLSSSLIFCYALHGILQPDICRPLQGLIVWIARPLIDLFGR